MGHEAHIGGKTIGENTEVRTNIKTLVKVAIGLFTVLMAMFTVFYFDMKARDQATNERLDATVKEIKEDIQAAVGGELSEFDNRQRKITEDIGSIRGDIKVILDRTSNHRSGTSTINQPNSPPELRAVDE